MRSVHVGISHYNYLVVSQSRKVKGFAVLFGTNVYAEGSKNILYLFTFIYSVLHCLFHVKDLASQRKNGLKFPVAPCLAVPPAESPQPEYLAVGRIPVGTVSQFSGKPDPENSFCAAPIPLLPGCMACCCSKDDLRTMIFASLDSLP